MFIVTSRYHAPSEAIARALPAHRAWVEEQYARGIFVLSGRLVPPTGGFMLARGVTREGLDALLASDPFRLQDLLVHDVVELQPTRWIEALAELEGAA